MTFDVAGEKGLKKRFFIEQVESQTAETATLFKMNDLTQIVIAEKGLSPVGSISQQDIEVSLDVTRIGGLTEQLEELNERLRRLCLLAKKQVRAGNGLWNAGLLLHGYEGTGKSLLLSELCRSGFRKTYELNKSHLLGTASKNDATISSTFGEALANQPSLIVMDDLDQVAAAGNEVLLNTVRSISASFTKITGHAVLVVGATRNPMAIESSLLAPDRFEKLIELPVPDSTARVQIIKTLTQQPDGVCQDVGSRTHGFTGKDLHLLVRAAMDRAINRALDNEDEWVNLNSQRSSPESDTLHSTMDGAAHSQATTAVEQPTQDLFNPAVQLDDFEVALKQVRPTALREIILETPSVTWDNIGGSEDMQKRFDRIIGWPLKQAEVLARFGRTHAQRGVLLYGPPGCSKTMTAQAVANTYGLNFIAVKGAELISMYVGESERAVREVFRKAKAAAPSIIFFDEIDAIGGSRDGGGHQGLNVLTTLLNEMDGFEALKGVHVLAATNRPETLDAALMRPGRFDAHVYLGPPNETARRQILEINTKVLNLGSPSITALAKKTEGYSGAEIVGICNQAIDIAVEKAILGGGDDGVGEADFDAVIAQTSKGITKEMLAGYESFAKVG